MGRGERKGEGEKGRGGERERGRNGESPSLPASLKPQWSMKASETDEGEIVESQREIVE